MHEVESCSGEGDRICAVIVTFNRKNLLMGCIESLHRMTRRPDTIFVIDNHSTDGTVELLKERFPEIECVRQSHNRGSAGGFGAALELGHQRGYDWIWLMDDDIELKPDCLEVMCRYRSISKFIQVRREGPEGVVSLEALWDASMGMCLNMPTDLSFERSDRDWIPVRWGNFEGPLVHRSIVDRIGLPEERFFLSGDDLMYGYAASYHTNVIYLRYVGVLRQLEMPKSITPLRWYMLLRNRFLIRELLKRDGVRVTPRILEFGMILLALWSLQQIFRSSSQNRWLSIEAVWRGLRDGWKGKFGPPGWLTKH